MVLRKIKKMYFIRYFTVSYHALSVNQNITKNDRYRKKIRTQKKTAVPNTQNDSLSGNSLQIRYLRLGITSAAMI